MATVQPPMPAPIIKIFNGWADMIFLVLGMIFFRNTAADRVLVNYDEQSCFHQQLSHSVENYSEHSGYVESERLGNEAREHA